jgi:anti-sigma-K factor RskA
VNTPLTRDDAFAMLPELALGMLPAEEAERVMVFVRESTDLQAELASLRGATGTLGSSAPQTAMPTDRKSALRDRLMARAAETIASDATGSTTSVATPATPVLRIEPKAAQPVESTKVRDITTAPSSAMRLLGPLLAVAASLALVVTQIRMNDVAKERDAARDALRAASASAQKLTGELASRDSLVASLTNANVRVVELVSTSNLEPGARMFWDRVANRWTMVTHDLKPVGRGRTYQLWLVTAKSEKISAGTFNTDARGRAVVQATYALAEADLAAIAITEEPEGGSAQPTGTILVAGAATR